MDSWIRCRVDLYAFFLRRFNRLFYASDFYMLLFFRCVCVCVCVCVLFIGIVQRNWACLTWKSAIEIKSLLLLLLVQPGLFSMYYLTHCTATKTPFSELPQALNWSAIVFSVTRAVISLLPNILWCHSLLAFDILFPWAITMTRLASFSGCCHLWVADNYSCPHRLAHMTRRKGDYVYNLCCLC